MLSSSSYWSISCWNILSKLTFCTISYSCPSSHCRVVVLVYCNVPLTVLYLCVCSTSLSSSLDRFYGVYPYSYRFFICQSGESGSYDYKLIPQSKTWFEAKDYCRTEFDGLAVTNSFHNVNASVKQKDFPLWVGLRRDGKTHSHIRGGFCTSN